MQLGPEHETALPDVCSVLEAVTGMPTAALAQNGRIRFSGVPLCGTRRSLLSMHV